MLGFKWKVSLFLQDNHINVVHIESRKSRTSDTEAEIYVELETDNIRLQELIKRLKKQVAGISYNDIPVPPSPATAARVPATGNAMTLETLRHMLKLRVILKDKLRTYCDLLFNIGLNKYW